MNSNRAGLFSHVDLVGRTSMQRLLEPGYRLLTSLVAAVLTFLLSPWLPDVGSRIVLAWDTGVSFLLALIAIMMWRTQPHETLRRARKEETSSIVILLVTILAVLGPSWTSATACQRPKACPRPCAFSASASPLSACFSRGCYSTSCIPWHYAKLYYGKVDDHDTNAFRKGLAFLGNKDVVDYWDFVYYSFTIAMCYQTCDVTIMSPYMRRLTIFHATVSYVFALAILGLPLDGFITSIN